METTIYQGKEMRFIAAMANDGSKVFVQFEDKQERVPGFDEAGNRFEVYTSWWRLVFPAPRGPNGEQLQENYSQVEKTAARLCHGGVSVARWMADEIALDSMGVDMTKGLVPITDPDLEEMKSVMMAYFMPKAAPLQPSNIGHSNP